MSGDDHFIRPDNDVECPNCYGAGIVWGCWYGSQPCDCLDNQDGLGCDPQRCDRCKGTKEVRRSAA